MFEDKSEPPADYSVDGPIPKPAQYLSELIKAANYPPPVAEIVQARLERASAFMRHYHKVKGTGKLTVTNTELEETFCRRRSWQMIQEAKHAAGEAGLSVTDEMLTRTKYDGDPKNLPEVIDWDRSTPGSA